MTAAYGIAERAADLIKAMYGVPLSGSSTTDSGTPSGSDSGSPSGGNNVGAAKSTLSTGAKAAIAGAAVVAAIALMAVRFLCILVFPR
jgi:hypothetical protein